MIRRFADFAFAFVFLSIACSLAAQQAPATQQQPAQQQPAQQQPAAQQPAQTQQQQQEQQRQEQQRQEQQRRADEQLRKDQEAERQRFANSLPPPPTSVAKTAPPQVSEPCLPLEMPRDQGFDLKDIPLEDWLARPETQEIPWKLQVRSPELRLDQKYQVGYLGKIDGKDLQWSAGRHELRYVSGVSSPDGRWLVTPKSFRQLFPELPQNRFSVNFSDCVFLQPGQYVVWMAVYDTGSKRHSIFKRSIHLPEWPAETLPTLTSQLPAVEFPMIFGQARRNLQAFPGPFVLAVDNKPALKLQVISLLPCGPVVRTGRHRSHNQQSCPERNWSHLSDQTGRRIGIHSGVGPDEPGDGFRAAGISPAQLDGPEFRFHNGFGCIQGRRPRARGAQGTWNVLPRELAASS
jgi:hypothetical protein